MRLLKSANALFFRLLYIFFWTTIRSGLARSYSRPNSLKTPGSFRLEYFLANPAGPAMLGVYIFLRAALDLTKAKSGLLEFRSLSLAASQVSAASTYTKRFLSTFSVFSVSAAALVYSKLALELVPLSKLFFAWGALFFFSYLMLSGFVFFLKRYSFGRFTTIISRF